MTVAPTGFASNCDGDKLDSSGELLPKYAYVCSSGCVSVIKQSSAAITDVCVPNSSGIAVKPSNNVGFKVIDEIDNTHLFIFIDPSVGVLNTSLSTVNTNLTSHINNKSNPHGVTKSQVGLGNVPNVTTNDQAPTYTEASAISKLSSGEKLSTAFGKISKAITDLIAHIADKNNPHGVTKAQVGLSNVNNTSDTNKPVSTAQATAIADAKKSGTDAQSVIDTHKADTNNPHKVSKAQVGLGNVDNTSDANKPISTAVQTALNKKASTTHASTHKTGGSDALSCEDIGAAAKLHASNHFIGGADAITPADIGAVTQADFDELENKVYNLEFGGGFIIIDSVTGHQYTLGMQDGKLVVILVNDNKTTE